MSSEAETLARDQNEAQAEYRALASQLEQLPTEQVKFRSDNEQGDCTGTTFGDFSKTKKGLIVLHEWWGATEFMLKEAREFAIKGDFVTLAPDLYRGKVTHDYDTAAGYFATYDWAGGVKDVQGAARYMLSRGCTKVGVTGFSLGAAVSLAAAATVPELSASAPFYGIPRAESDLADLRNIRIPLQLHFGELDEIANFSDVAAQQLLRKTLDDAGVKYDFQSYPKGRHAFMDYEWRKFNLESRRLAVQSLLTFMNQHLS